MERNREQREQRKGKYFFIQVVLHAQNNRDKWYIDSGFSSYMTRDRENFITLKKNEFIVTFEGNGSSKIFGKDTLSLENERDNVENVMCVEDLKHNLLSVR
jgi:hypothetical protein